MQPTDSESDRDVGLISAETALYVQWKKCGRHLEEYAAELFGTAFLVFCVVGVVAALFGTSSPLPHLLPFVTLRLLIAGLFLGTAGGLVAISPPGRLSGAHINPAVTFGFWLQNKMHLRDAVWYVVCQMLGALGGALLGRAAFGRLALQVKYAALIPRPSASIGGTFLAEAATTCAMTWLVYTCVSSPRLMRWTPAVLALLIGVLVALDGNYSGCGMNPARWFGPAFVSACWRMGWVYLVGPLCGAVIAVLLRKVQSAHPPHTGKLFHDSQYRSLFRYDRASSTPPKHLQK